MNREHEKLIEELTYNAEVGEQPLEQRLADTAAWFFNNKDRIPPMDLAKRCEFLTKTCLLLIEICALQTDRLHQTEGKNSKLWLPRGLNASGDVRKFG